MSEVVCESLQEEERSSLPGRENAKRMQVTGEVRHVLLVDWQIETCIIDGSSFSLLESSFHCVKTLLLVLLLRSYEM